MQNVCYFRANNVRPSAGNENKPSPVGEGGGLYNLKKKGVAEATPLKSFGAASFWETTNICIL